MNFENEYKKLKTRLRELRRIERTFGSLKEEKNNMANNPVIPSQQQYGFQSVQSLRDNLKNSLPSYMNPSNVGNINQVAWFFYEQVNFDFGTNPTLTPATRQTQSFQVSQEAALLLMSVSRTFSTYSTSAGLGPWLVEFRDRQSSRQFNDLPVPLQMIGTKSNPSILPTPMLLMPNAFFDVTMTTFATSQATVGESKHQLSFFGYRVRIEDADQVLGTIFG